MSERNNDRSGRFRNRTVAFRMSGEEAKRLDRLVAMSGMTKQDYIIARLFEQEVVVVPSSRILKNLADVISDFTSELKSVGNSGEITQETSEAIAMLAHVVAGLNGDILPRKSDPLLSIGKDGIVATKHDDGEVR